MDLILPQQQPNVVLVLQQQLQFHQLQRQPL